MKALAWDPKWFTVTIFSLLLLSLGHLDYPQSPPVPSTAPHPHPTSFFSSTLEGLFLPLLLWGNHAVTKQGASLVFQG